MPEFTKEKTEVKFYDLIYAGEDVENIIKAKYPNAIIKDASDEIHPERFEVEIPNVTDDEFYPFAIKSGFPRCCFRIELMLTSLTFPEPKFNPFGKHERGQNDALDRQPTHAETKAKLDKWIELSKS